MTSPAIKLAKECGFCVFGEKIVAADDGVSGRCTVSLSRFHTLAQAQALESAAEKCLDGFFAAELLRMAEELRRGA